MTSGAALDDVWDFENNVSINKPSKFAWPQLLADQLNLECVNLAVNGSSNKEISHTIINTPEITSNDVVIVQWTNINRWCVIQDDLSVKQIVPNKDTGETKIYYSNLHTTSDSLFDIEMRRSWADLYFKNLGVTIYHIRSRSELADIMTLRGRVYRTVAESSILHLQSNVEDIQQSLKTSANDAGIIFKKGHPCKNAHQLHSSQLFQQIRNMELA
jgi:hypothetical protein